MCDVNFQILYWSKNAAVEARKLRKSGHVKSACSLTKYTPKGLHYSYAFGNFGKSYDCGQGMITF